MNREIKSKIELWIKNLGYNFDNKLYSQISKLSYSQPSYKVMADIILKNIKNYNPTISSDDAWRYTTIFVNNMKSNMISNNDYFQSVFDTGFLTKRSEENDKINLFDMNTYKNNEYSFLKNIWINNKEGKKLFDFIMIINGFPLILIDVVDSNRYNSFEEAFFILEETTDKFPMLFNFNKLILLTDGITHKLGTIYNFPEEYIKFNDQVEESEVKNKYNINQLEKLLVSENVLKFLNINKNCMQIHDYIGKILEKEEKLIIKDNLTTNKLKTKEIISIVDNEDQIDSELDKEELSFLAEIFNPDLNIVLDSNDFKKKLEGSKEVPDFKENKEYIEDIQKNKNINTLETFVKANERLVLKVVNRFIGNQTPSMDFDDLYQLGYMGLLEALKRFDLNRENEFSTYAVNWIRQSITRGINNDSLIIRIPVYQWDNIFKLRKLERSSEIKFNKIDYDWISKELDISKEEAMELLKTRNTFMNIVSLDVPVGEEENTKLGEFIEDEAINIEEIILNNDLKNRLEEILNILDDRSKDIIIKRFGLDGEEPMTLEEIGTIYNISRERIRQIESKTLKKLRDLPRIEEFKNYLEE